MSWSVSATGKPENVAKYLEEQSAKQSGQSKIEYDDALPNLVGLVLQNFRNDATPQGMIRIEASGSGSARTDPETKADIQVSRGCRVKIESFYINLV